MVWAGGGGGGAAGLGCVCLRRRYDGGRVRAAGAGAERLIDGQA
eukprot:SAG11_NODE_13_length_26388_cov_67.360341_34_plen_43_part_01